MSETPVTKREVFVVSGRRGARKRWGAPHKVKLTGLPDDARQAVYDIVEALRAAQRAADTGDRP